MLNVNGFTGQGGIGGVGKGEGKKTGSLTSRKNEALKERGEKKEENTQKTQKADVMDFSGLGGAAKTAGTYGKMKVGTAAQKNSELSETAKDYLAKLKEKYGNMDFIIADFSSDEEADKLLAQGKGEYNVLISPDLLEKMAADDAVAAKYEGMIDESVNGIEEVKTELAEDNDMVDKFGVTIDSDGNMTLRAKLIEGLVDKDGNGTVKGNTVQELLDRLNEVKESQADKIAKMREEKAEKAKNAEASEKEDKTGKTEKTTTDTDDVDDEISKLNDKKKTVLAQLKGKTGTEKDGLMRQLQEIERELAHKDNAAYRRSHSKVS